MYIPRHASAAIASAAKMFGAVLLTGARQVGKTTLLQTSWPELACVTLDDPVLRQSAARDGGSFFKDNPPPLIVDEAQYEPGLFPYIKMIIDSRREKGLFFLTGSQQFHMMKNVSESLAGRLAIITLPGLSLREINAVAATDPFLPVDAYYQTRQNAAVRSDYETIWEFIHRGSMPELWANRELDREMYYSAYTKTYIERDVRALAQVGDENKFVAFMTAAAARTGGLLNLSSLAGDAGVSVPTAERWLSILVTSNLVYLLRPFYQSPVKRLVKAPKLYFTDTGLAAYLTGWNSVKALRNGAMAGAYFETFVVTEIWKSYLNKGSEPPLFFYRDHDGREIDLLLHGDGTLYPLEIKKHATPDRRDLAAFAVLEKYSGMERGPGGIVCLYDKLLSLSATDKVIPAWLL